jgi:type IX secretion system PorP/SprF family membrane protein
MKKVFLILIAVLFAEFSFGQQLPFYPVSYRIFSPLIINPAYAGSKDFFSADIIAGFQGETYSQIISGNTRISKKVPGYVLSSKSSEFTNIGVGGSVFNTMNDTSQLSGAGAGFSYHIPINKESLTFLSIGASVKGAYYLYKGDEDLSRPSKEFIFPNADFGIYLYNPSFFAGLSATNLLGRNDTLTKYYVPLSRQYNLQAGVKILISRSLRLVVEPSVMINTDDSLSFDIKENIEPMLKVYAGNFCIGTYFNDYSKISFFFQYRFPRLYVGAFFALPKDSPYFKETPTTEIAVGINFTRNKSGFTKNGHW